MRDDHLDLQTQRDLGYVRITQPPKTMTPDQIQAIGTLIDMGLHVEVSTVIVVGTQVIRIAGRIREVTSSPVPGMPRTMTLDTRITINADLLPMKDVHVQGKDVIFDALEKVKHDE